MRLDLKSLKSSVISRVRRKIGEFLLPSGQQKLIRQLFSPSEQDQMAAAAGLGRNPDVQTLCLLQFYLQDSFLDELLGSLPGREFLGGLAEKRSIRFHSRLAASLMLSDRPFFSYVLQEIGSPAMDAEERCDLACAVGEVFGAFGQEAKLGDGACEEFISALLAVLSSPEEQEEMKVAAAMALKKAVGNPMVLASLLPQTQQSALSSLAVFGNAPA